MSSTRIVPGRHLGSGRHLLENDMRQLIQRLLVMVSAVCCIHGASRGQEAVARLNDILQRPMLLTAGDESATAKFSCVLWNRIGGAGAWVVVERSGANLAMVSAYLDGTPMSVHVDEEVIEFFQLPHASWSYGKLFRPYLKVSADQSHSFQVEKRVVKQRNQAEIHLDIESLARALLHDPSRLQYLRDERRFVTTTTPSNVQITLDVSKDDAAYPVRRYEIMRGEDGGGIRILTGSDMRTYWTQVKLSSVADLHDPKFSEAFKQSNREFPTTPPTGAARALAWELPKRLKINRIIPDESPGELLHRTLARPARLTGTDESVSSRFAVERRIQQGNGVAYQVHHERIGDEFAMLIRTATGDPVALIGRSWLFTLDSDRGWVFCSKLFAKGGNAVGTLPGWRLGRLLGVGLNSLDLDPFVNVRKFVKGDWKFDEARNQLTLVSAENSITLDLTPDAEDVPLRHSSMKLGKIVDEQTYVSGMAVKPIWTKVTAAWLRTEFKPAEVPYSDTLSAGIVKQLMDGLSDANRERSRQLSQAVMKLADAVELPTQK